MIIKEDFEISYIYFKYWLIYLFKVIYIIRLRFFVIKFDLIKNFNLPPPKKADNSG